MVNFKFQNMSLTLANVTSFKASYYARGKGTTSFKAYLLWRHKLAASGHLRVSPVRQIPWNVVPQDGEIRGAVLMYRRSSKNHTQGRENESIKHGQRAEQRILSLRFSRDICCGRSGRQAAINRN